MRFENDEEEIIFERFLPSIICLPEGSESSIGFRGIENLDAYFDKEFRKLYVNILKDRNETF